VLLLAVPKVVRASVPLKVLAAVPVWV
jgi:hypothetical protein